MEIASGNKKAELVLKNGILLNVISGEFYRTDIAIQDGYIVGMGNDYEGEVEEDASDYYVLPGFIDSHVHIESSMLSPAQFAKAVLKCGTTTIVADPHEIANVCGCAGVDYILDAAKRVPLNIFVMLPSCVPATPFETCGGEFSIKEMKKYLDHEGVLGLAELMNFPGVIFKDPSVLEKIELFRDRRIDGHAPLLHDKDLSAYVVAGITSDHECTCANEAREKLRQGMSIMIREGSATKNLDALMPMINRYNSPYLLLATDDRHPDEIEKYGHIDYMVRKIIDEQGDISRAVRMASINSAKYFSLPKLGAIAPGYIADLLLVSDIRNLTINKVYKSGKLAVDNGKFMFEDQIEQIPDELLNTVVLKKDLQEKDFEVKIEKSETRIRVIGIIEDQILTEKLEFDMETDSGKLKQDISRDLLKISVVERYGKNSNIANCFVHGFGFKKGAIASTVAHDSHNLLIVGTHDSDMAVAGNFLKEIGGGLVIVIDGKVVNHIKLEIAGLMTQQNITEVNKKLEEFKSILEEMGSVLKNPFITLSFLALPVIPELKITDCGLFDVGKFAFTDLEV
ncbi:adenine deaminase [bacterium]|nr:adenine deaminase [bacterium]